MSNQPNFDVAIIGGGPAGCAAAIALRKYAGLRAVLLEASDYDKRWPGQTVSSSILPLLDYLGAQGAMNHSKHLLSYGVDAAWGQKRTLSHDSVFNAEGPGWYVDRTTFDSHLANISRDVGVHVMTGTRVTSSSATDCGWNIWASTRNMPRQQMTVQFVIDATGCDAAFSRAQGARKQIDDTLVAAGLVVQHASNSCLSQRLLLESTTQGWWYISVLPAGRELIVFMTDSAIIRGLHITTAASLLKLTRETEHIGRRVGDGKPLGHLWIKPAYSGMLTPIGDERWVAVGDAATSFDPLSSMGIGHALHSGIHGARVANSCLKGEVSILKEYESGLRSNYAQYQSTRKNFYLIEQRWRSERFWLKRHQSNCVSNSESVSRGMPNRNLLSEPREDSITHNKRY